MLAVSQAAIPARIVCVTNYGWSTKKDEVPYLKFYVGSLEFSVGGSIGTGKNYDRKGFVTTFGANSFPAFDSASTLRADVASLGELVGGAAEVVVDLVYATGERFPIVPGGI